MMNFGNNLNLLIMRKLFILLVTATILCMGLCSCQQSQTCSSSGSYKQYQKKVDTSKQSAEKSSKQYQRENPF